MPVKNNQIAIKATKSEFLSRDSKNTEGADFKSPENLESPDRSSHGQITPNQRGHDSQKAWHEKWWGDIIIGLVGLVFVLMARVITM